jgi:molybdopterin-containing oxidoreductase family membrane subunit
MAANVAFFMLELFTSSNSQVLWANCWIQVSFALGILGLVLIALPGTRANEKLLPYTLFILVLAIWIDKALAPFGAMSPYSPNFAEIMISLGVYGVAALVVSVLWMITLAVKKEAGTFSEP